MRTKQIAISLFFFLCGIAIFAQQDTLFSLSFNDPTLTPAQSGSTTLKTLETEYGIVKYLNLSIYNDDKIYRQIEKFGWIDFKSGSETINSTNSYIQLPELSFVNGGSLYINFGAGSTGRTLRLQEWDGTQWINGNYAEVETIESSTWYEQYWNIEGAGNKIFRLVITSSPPIYITNIEVYGNLGSIDADCVDPIDFGQVNVNDDSYKVDSFNVTGSYLSSSISVVPTSPFKVSTEKDGVYYSSIIIPSTGGKVYVKYKPTAIIEQTGLLTLSSTGAVPEVVNLVGEGIYLSDEKSIISFNLEGYEGIINEAEKTISLTVPSSFDLTQSYTPTITISDSATLLTKAAQTFEDEIAIAYFVEAEDGTTNSYNVIVDQLSGENDILSFVLESYEGTINEIEKTISIKVPSTFDLSQSYVPVVTVSDNATLQNLEAVVFEAGVAVIYTVEAEDGTTNSYNVIVDQLSGENSISSFELESYTGEIDEVNKIIVITVASTFDLSIAYTPVIQVSDKATLLTVGSNYFVVGDTLQYSVESEDGLIAIYDVVVDKLTDNPFVLFEDQIKVFSNNNKITILTPEEKRYDVFSISGALLKAGVLSPNIPTHILLNKGIYIVVIDNNPYKVILK